MIAYEFSLLLLLCVENEDFVSTSELVEWHQDSLSLTQCVSVAIINDECVEEKEEYFNVSLSTEEECVEFGDVSEVNVVILDDDGGCMDLYIIYIYMGFLVQSNLNNVYVNSYSRYNNYVTHVFFSRQLCWLTSDQWRQLLSSMILWMCVSMCVMANSREMLPFTLTSSTDLQNASLYKMHAKC